VAHSGDSEESHSWWILGPGDEPFLTQSLQVHFVELFPGGSNHGHGHQNEACFYILEGTGYELHDGNRYDRDKADFRAVHTAAAAEVRGPGGRSAKDGHMAAGVVWALSGRGAGLHWDVAGERGGGYQARIAKEPTRWTFGPGDLIYVPQNPVHDHFAEGDEP